jgi:hypothetical protein
MIEDHYKIFSNDLSNTFPYRKKENPLIVVMGGDHGHGFIVTWNIT